MRKGLILGAIIVGVILVFYLSFAGYYNRFVAMDEEINQRWAQVESQLLRRNDLIPSLVESVKGFMGHEREIFEKIAEARTRYAGAQTIPEKIKASNDLGSALARLLVIVENYPVLKTNETFIRLMDELAGTENRIAVERMRYNEAVQRYNTAIRRFPANLIAGIFGFTLAAYFEVPPEAQVVPEVKF
jgi:LemA protein